MAWHKRLKAGDVVYSSGVRILAKNSASIAVDVDKTELIVHMTNCEPGGYSDETKKNVKE